MRGLFALIAFVFSFSLTGCQFVITIPNPVKIVWDAFDQPSGTEYIFQVHKDLENLFYDSNSLRPAKLFNGALENMAEELKSKNMPFHFIKIEDTASIIKAKRQFTEEYKKAEALNAYIHNAVRLEFAALKGLLAAVDSSHTAFIAPERFKEIKRSNRGKSDYSGIGATVKKLEDNFYYMSLVIPDSPAAEAGIQKFDRLLKINGSVIPNDVIQISKLLRGNENSSVEISLERKGEVINFKAVRRVFALRPVSSHYLDRDNLKIVYVEFRDFNSDSVDELEKIIRLSQKDGVQGIILDLRGNRGGSVNSLKVVFKIFAIKENAMVIRRHYDDQELKVSGKPLTNLPMVVLADSDSASAAEIIAAVLQETKRARVIGTKTAGAVEISRIVPLPLGPAMSVAIFQVFTPEGEILEKIGVKPDEEILFSKKDIVAAQDIQLEAALAAVEKLLK